MRGDGMMENEARLRTEGEGKMSTGEGGEV